MHIQTVIERLMEDGGLTVADLSILLEKPRPTVHTWKEGREPKHFVRPHVVSRLAALVRRLEKTGAPLIPRNTNERLRKSLVGKLRDELFKLPKKDIA